MIRKLKVLGLALVAVFAMSAMAASAASAQQGVITSEFGENVTLTAEESGVERLTVGSDFVECPGSTFTGHAVLSHEQTTTGAEHAFLENGASEVTVTPHYLQSVNGTANCDATGGTSATVSMNGCDYRFYDFTTDGTGSAYDFLADLVCPPGANVEMRIYAGHSHGFQVCKDVITPGTGFTGGKAANGSGEHINLTGVVTGFTVHKSGLCGSETSNECKHDLSVTVGAHNENFEDEGVTLSH